jgi:hypothetical protein
LLPSPVGRRFVVRSQVVKLIVEVLTSWPKGERCYKAKWC